MSSANYKHAKVAIHTNLVQRSIRRSHPNRVLGTKTPPVHKSEISLPRKTRSTMAQLRSGHCARLRDYQFRLGKSPNDVCPNCDIFTQDVPHVFDCPARPTTLTTQDIWDNPRDVANYIRSTPTFDFQPPPASPPRRRHPARPPADPPDPLFSPLSFPPSPLLPPPIRPTIPPLILTPPPSGPSSPLRGVNP